MELRLQNFSTLVQTMAAGVQASSARLVDLSVGSVLRAVLEANAGIGLWMQHLTLRVLQATRAATSAGADLDSWMADFSLSRLPAVPAAGSLTFSRAVPGLAAVIAPGTMARSTDGTRGFVVVADSSHPNWDANAYMLAADGLDITLPVVAVEAGAGGNVLPGTITELASPLPGIDAVTNAAAMAQGRDAETDADFRARFQDYLATRSRATADAVAYAIAQVQQGLRFLIQENVDAAGAPRLGHFVVTVDDGSGDPSAALLDTLTASVEAVRPLGSSFTLRAPEVVMVDVALTLSLAPGTAAAPLVAAVGQAVRAHIDGLGIGMGLPLSRLAQLAHDADRAVWGVSAMALNGVAADISPPAHAVLKAGTVSVA